MWFFFTAVVVWDRPRSAGTWGRGVGTHTVHLVISEGRHPSFLTRYGHHLIVELVQKEFTDVRAVGDGRVG